MVQYTPSSTVAGGWVKKAELKNGQRAKIVSEATPQPSAFFDDKGNAKTQDVAKVHFEGQKEAVNCNINKPTINGLIKAFGTDSKEWIGKYVTVELEKVKVSGKTSLALYLVPEGFVKKDDADGFTVIVPENEEVQTDDEPKIKEEDLPF